MLWLLYLSLYAVYSWDSVYLHVAVGLFAFEISTESEISTEPVKIKRQEMWTCIVCNSNLPALIDWHGLLDKETTYVEFYLVPPDDMCCRKDEQLGINLVEFSVNQTFMTILFLRLKMRANILSNPCDLNVMTWDDSRIWHYVSEGFFSHSCFM